MRSIDDAVGLVQQLQAEGPVNSREALRLFKLARKSWRRRRLLLIAGLALFVCALAASAAVTFRAVRRRRGPAPPESHRTGVGADSQVRQADLA